jgi:hypothetical protein
MNRSVFCGRLLLLSALLMVAHSQVAVAVDNNPTSAPDKAGQTERPTTVKGGVKFLPDRNGSPPQDERSIEGGGNPGAQVAPEFSNASTIVRDLSQAPLFAFASGLASILGLLFALYATQVRTIPFSLYRSLMWRKALLLSSGAGFLIFGGMKFYAQPQAPFLSPLREIHAILVGELRVSPLDYKPHGSVVWATVLLVGIAVLIVGFFYDPAAIARTILIREQDALHKALDKQVSHLLGGREAADLQPPDSQILADTLEYYRHVEWRFADVVLGAPPPAFPLFYERHQRNADVET